METCTWRQGTVFEDCTPDAKGLRFWLDLLADIWHWANPWTRFRAFKGEVALVKMGVTDLDGWWCKGLLVRDARGRERWRHARHKLGYVAQGDRVRRRWFGRLHVYHQNRWVRVNYL